MDLFDRSVQSHVDPGVRVAPVENRFRSLDRDRESGVAKDERRNAVVVDGDTREVRVPLEVCVGNARRQRSDDLVPRGVGQGIQSDEELVQSSLFAVRKGGQVRKMRDDSLTRGNMYAADPVIRRH